jgi:3'-5' exoribonuclease
MKSPYIGSLTPNEVVTGEFLVLSKEIRRNRTGEPYLVLQLGDRTGDMEAKMWDNAAEVIDAFGRDDFVRVKGVLQFHQNRTQFTVHKLRRLEENEIDPADFLPCSERDPEEMFLELRAIIAGLTDPHLRALLDSIFSDAQLTAAYKIAPAAKTIHHACRSGLLEHVLSLCCLCRLLASHYKGVDIDLLLAGAILHDIGKIEELSYARSFGYSAEGQLLGHIVIGLRLVGAKMDQIPEFPPKLRTLVEHLIISHHGELEFGSPKIPLFTEALLLHHLDNLDSRMDAMRNALKREQVLDSEFTGWVAPLERILLRKDRYLREAPRAPDRAAPSGADSAPAPVAPERDGEQREQTAAAGPAHPAPGQPARPSGREEHPRTNEKPPANKPAPITSFGEKLQAVLRREE